VERGDGRGNEGGDNAGIKEMKGGNGTDERRMKRRDGGIKERNKG